MQIRRNMISLLLALTLVLGLTVPAGRTEAAGGYFFMKAVSDAEQPVDAGEQFTVGIYGGQQRAEENKMTSFQFTIGYPADQVKLVEMTPEFPYDTIGSMEISTDLTTVAYNSGGAEGLPLDSGKGNRLLTATFEVLPEAKSGTVEIALTDTEISRPQDKVGVPVPALGSASVTIEVLPILKAERTASGDGVTVQLHRNRAGTLIAAVYGEGGRMLRCKLVPGVEAQSAPREIPVSLEGGREVKVMLVDGTTYAPLCAAAVLALE